MGNPMRPGTGQRDTGEDGRADMAGAASAAVRPGLGGPLGLGGPPDPARPGHRIDPFRAVLHPPAAVVVPGDRVVDLALAPTTLRVHPELPEVPVWGVGQGEKITSPGPLLEAPAAEHPLTAFCPQIAVSEHPLTAFCPQIAVSEHPVTAFCPQIAVSEHPLTAFCPQNAVSGGAVMIRWRNGLPASVDPADPGRPVPPLPFATAVVDDPNGDNDSVQNQLGAQGANPRTSA
jgi:hypothetical protein